MRERKKDRETSANEGRDEGSQKGTYDEQLQGSTERLSETSDEDQLGWSLRICQSSKLGEVSVGSERRRLDSNDEFPDSTDDGVLSKKGGGHKISSHPSELGDLTFTKKKLLTRKLVGKGKGEKGIVSVRTNVPRSRRVSTKVRMETHSLSPVLIAASKNFLTTTTSPSDSGELIAGLSVTSENAPSLTAEEG